MHVLTVVGARPQFIKAFPVSLALGEAHDETLVHTGQHYDRMMSDVFFDELDVPTPDHHLGIGSAAAGEQIGGMMQALQPIVDEADPDVLLTYGDTHSTLAAAAVGAHADVLLGHVEAGLRSHNRDMPEEINRILTDHAADLLFAPTARAVRTLQREGISAGVHRTGDVMVDALGWARDVAADRSDICDGLGLQADSYILATVHRASNTADIDRLCGIIDTLGAADLQVVLPAHPRTVDRLEAEDKLAWAREQIRLIDPVGYIDFIDLLANASRTVTDSGGVQKEAFLLDTPCVTLRDETEWPETVEAGWNTLVGADPDAIASAIRQPFLVEDKPHPFGDGTAAEAIRDRLEGAVQLQDGIREPAETDIGIELPASDYQRGN